MEETVVTIISETIGARTLCARLFSGELARAVEVTVVYESRTAVGES